jgi:hypothetical protein
MSREDEYIAVLSSAIAQIETDSFEARGVVYDRLWRMVVEQLRDAHDHPDEMIAVERAAFLRAVQAIEFGTRLPAAPGAASAPPPRRAQTGLARKPARRPLLGRIALRMVAACAALALIWFGYVLTVVRLDSTAATRWGDGSVPNSWQSQIMRAARSLSHLIDGQPEVTASVGQRAVLYEESATTATGNTFSGHAIWRHHVESTSEPPTVVLSIDVAIPQKSILLQMSLKRAPEGGAISHFVEFQFTDRNQSLSDVVEDVLGILMKPDELSRGIELVGKIVKVQTGAFLMGLSGAEADVKRNLELLKERPWLDIPVVMKDRSRSILAIEKGTSGQVALDQTLAAWGGS